MNNPPVHLAEQINLLRPFAEALITISDQLDQLTSLDFAAVQKELKAAEQRRDEILADLEVQKKAFVETKIAAERDLKLRRETIERERAEMLHGIEAHRQEIDAEIEALHRAEAAKRDEAWTSHKALLDLATSTEARKRDALMAEHEALTAQHEALLKEHDRIKRLHDDMQAAITAFQRKK